MFTMPMRTMRWLSVAIVLTLPASLALADETEPRIDPDGPSSGRPAGPSPGELLRERPDRKAPDLTNRELDPVIQAVALVDWAAAAVAKEDDLVRRTVATGRQNPRIVEALCEHAFKVREGDHSRALVTLALIGEMRSSQGARCLERVISLPLPEEGTVVEGVILERRALEILQAKAIDGLAYQRSPETDELVLKAIAEHPSRIVRAEGIAAYLWNKEDSREARSRLRKYVRNGEEIFLDRVVRVQGERAESFNPKLKAYLAAHPELVPPKPEPRKPDEIRRLPPPPDFGPDRKEAQE